MADVTDGVLVGSTTRDSSPTLVAEPIRRKPMIGVPEPLACNPLTTLWPMNSLAPRTKIDGFMGALGYSDALIVAAGTVNFAERRYLCIMYKFDGLRPGGMSQSRKAVLKLLQSAGDERIRQNVEVKVWSEVNAQFTRKYALGCEPVNLYG